MVLVVPVECEFSFCCWLHYSDQTTSTKLGGSDQDDKIQDSVSVQSQSQIPDTLLEGLQAAIPPQIDQ